MATEVRYGSPYDHIESRMLPRGNCRPIRFYRVPGQSIKTTSLRDWLSLTIWHCLVRRVYAEEIAHLEQQAAVTALEQALRDRVAQNL